MDSLAAVSKALWSIHPQRFWVIWCTITIASLIYVKWLLGPIAITSRQERMVQSVGIKSIRQQIRDPKSILALTLLVGFLGFYIFMILVWEDFAYYDNDLFIVYSLKGYNFPPPIWQDNGRFFPFGLQEFNLVSHLTTTPFGYHVVPIVELLIFCCFLLILDSELRMSSRVMLATLALLTPSILLSFTGLIFPERNVLVLIGCMALAIRQFEQTKASHWATAAVLSTQIMLYLKETSFLLVLGFAVGRSLLRCMEGPHGWSLEKLWDRENRLDLCLACLGVLFLFAYFTVMGLHGNMNYISSARHPVTDVVLNYLGLDLMVWLFIAVPRT